MDHTLPFIDLHRHIEGSARLETILDLGQRFGLPLPAADLEGLRPHVQVTSPQPGVMAFIEKFKWPVGVLVNDEACRRIAYESVEDGAGEGLDYLELRFSPWFMAEPNRLDPERVVEAVIDGVAAASADTGLRVNLLGILSRTYGPEVAWKELNVLLQHREGIAGLDLAGDEANFPGELFVEHFKEARDAGWAITAHAGESAGPDSIWQAIKELGARRIGHAVHALDDPKLLDYMFAHGIGIEANLTSNVQTSTVPDYPSHPLKIFLERGLLASINTDDPAISGIDLAYEYRAAGELAGLDDVQIRQAQNNVLATAFLSAGEKQALLDRKRELAEKGKRGEAQDRPGNPALPA